MSSRHGVLSAIQSYLVDGPGRSLGHTSPQDLFYSLSASSVGSQHLSLSLLVQHLRECVDSFMSTQDSHLPPAAAQEGSGLDFIKYHYFLGSTYIAAFGICMNVNIPTVPCVPL